MNSERFVQEIIEQISLCDQCELCRETCPTYKASNNEAYSPSFRLNVAEKLFKSEGSLLPEEIEAIYTCPQCGRCEVTCPQGIKVSEIVSLCRREFALKKIGPLDKHNQIIDGIRKNGNAVNGAPDKRWDWLPEPFPTKESDTLLYIGCLASYLVKNSARSSYLLLRELGVEFGLLKEEDCCGIYFYNVGNWNLAQEKFEENQERFKKLGVKKIITLCAGCFYCFKHYYPQVLGKIDFQITHIAEILPDLLKGKGHSEQKMREKITYLDPCRLGRKEGIYDPPRQALAWSGVEIAEMPDNREKALCCGAGAGIRSVYRQLSHDIALQALNVAPSDTVVTACPFCSFNLSYASQKGKQGKSIVYFADLVYQSLLKP